jgi:hypothetical protein
LPLRLRKPVILEVECSVVDESVLCRSDEEKG